MNDHGRTKATRCWIDKFSDAFRGVGYGVCGQSSFTVHFFFTVAVIVAGLWFQITRVEWCILVLCITVVLAAEMFNSALESVGRAIDTQLNPDLGQGLDTSSAAVLLASAGAAVTGAIVFGYHCGVLLQWW